MMPNQSGQRPGGALPSAAQAAGGGRGMSYPGAVPQPGPQGGPPGAGGGRGAGGRSGNGNGNGPGGHRAITPMPHGMVEFTTGNAFQRQVYYQPAPGVEGDFCDHNPRTTVNAGPGGLVAGEPGCMVGRFAWFDPDTTLDPNDAPKIVLCYTETEQPVVGFIHREQQGLNAHWLGGASMWIPAGFMITLHQTGGFFVRNAGDARAEIGMHAMAFMEDGSVAFADAGAPPAGTVETKWFAMSAGDPGSLIKMTAWPLG
jgi:hypothetical protein